MSAVTFDVPEIQTLARLLWSAKQRSIGFQAGVLSQCLPRCHYVSYYYDSRLCQKEHSHRLFFFMATTTQWQIIRPWAPSLRLAVREITSVSATFILSSTLSDRESDPSLASRGLIAAAEESDLQETEPVASSSAISFSSCNTTIEESQKSPTRSLIADALANGLSVTVNGSPWPRAFIRIDDQLDEAVIIVYALMPGRQYDVEFGLISNDQQSSDSNDATTPHLNSQVTTEGETFSFFFWRFNLKFFFFFFLFFSFLFFYSKT